MRQFCEPCGCSYDDENCSTVCPHKGIGYCAVCDCVICVCTPEATGRRWVRSANNQEVTVEIESNPPTAIITDRAYLQLLFSKAIKARLKEEIVDEILPKPTIAELEKMMDEAEKEGRELGRLLPSGEIMRSHPKPVFASDLADAVLSALQGEGLEIVASKKKESRTVLYARDMVRPGDEPLA